jgi:hypothetical protein
VSSAVGFAFMAPLHLPIVNRDGRVVTAEMEFSLVLLWGPCSALALSLFVEGKIRCSQSAMRRRWQTQPLTTRWHAWQRSR